MSKIVKIFQREIDRQTDKPTPRSFIPELKFFLNTEIVLHLIRRENFKMNKNQKLYCISSRENIRKQAEAELGQAQPNLELFFY